MSGWDGFAGAVAGALIGGGTSAVIAWRVVVATQRGSVRDSARKASSEACLRLKQVLLDAERTAERSRLTRDTGGRTSQRAKLFDLVTDAIELNAPLISDADLVQSLNRLYGVVGEYVMLADRRDAFVLEALRRRLEQGDDLRVEIEVDPVQVQARQEFCSFCSNLRNLLDSEVMTGHVRGAVLRDPEWPDELTPPDLIKVDECREANS